ncbi:expressed protein [Echinococcus multilocularis]|uniref:Expressed protein n=1 Tax=Echinococcus multilocularis TaxID=6211 RepID=A0A068YEX4_ECHMU|nr:expressed protein [Echinococcus multilocularis]
MFPTFLHTPVSGHHLVPTNVDLHCFLFIPASRFTTSGIILLDLHLWVCGSYRYYLFLSDARVCSFCQLLNVSVSLPCPYDPHCLEALLDFGVEILNSDSAPWSSLILPTQTRF